MEVKILAKLDKAGSEAKCNHYIIGNVGDAISGGIYVNKDTVLPDEIIVIFKKERIENA